MKSLERDSVTSVEFACLCGATRFHSTFSRASLPLPVHICHCSIYRRTHGALFTNHASLPHPPEWMAGSSEAACTRYRPAHGTAEMLFCSTCGTHVLDNFVANGSWMVSAAVLRSVDGKEGPGAAGLFKANQHCTKLLCHNSFYILRYNT
ncbi:hypothetical protein M427DRAFT_457552 [Gonapodya prolifera JEL478]|uniref:CENP-V/GFA domain-containing protein n=1 Tax=Gonapodya prolifera (strain JEL478) TaxID=1344416 RepID=A0A139A2R9_GONPJ|nr:hypothetical protein M427DRAFT_457552 [Gonapodya prolifera JEL478]|eukprot:KXS10948.1 hypothetical protein M427DRAFT_457552 [Gonapodya prolifera JEL478]